MCGIGGVWCFGQTKLDEKDAQRTRSLAINLENRGKDAFGFYNGEKVIKFPSSASDVIQMIDNIRPFKDLVIGRNTFLMHTRATTSGNPLKNKNNHPFELKDIVFAHNGVIYERKIVNIDYADTYEIFGDITTDIPETDSFEIGYKIQKMYNKYNDFAKAIGKALEELILQGDMALWIYDKRQDLLALFRWERPLYIGYIGNKLWFASEKWMLKTIGAKDIDELIDGELVIFSRNHIVYSDILDVEDHEEHFLRKYSREKRCYQEYYWREYRHYWYEDFWH